jgi:hypothetical protein
MPLDNNDFNNKIIKIYHSNPEAIRILFNYNFLNNNFDAQDNNGNTILHHIVSKNDMDTFNSVLNCINYNNGSKTILNKQNNNGDTPMHIAVRNKSFDMAKQLHLAGTNIKIKNNNGESIESDEPVQKAMSGLSSNMNKCSDSINLSDLEDTLPVRRMSVNSESNNMSSSEQFIRDLARELSNKNMSPSKYSVRNLLGGNAESESFSIGLVDINDNLQWEAKGGKRKGSKMNRAMSPSSQVHDSVLAELVKLMGTEEDARAIKAGLYSMVKSQFPELNNLDRAKKMEELLKDKKIMKELQSKIGELKEIVAEARKLKDQQKNNASNNEKPTKPKSSKSKK